MNLRNVANRLTKKINPNINGIIMLSDGYDVSEGFRQRPKYRQVPAIFQVQAFSPGDLKMPAGMNLQGVVRSVYANGNFYGPNRPHKHGGDLVKIADELWKVIVPVEIWPDWCHFIIALQLPKGECG